MSNRLPSREGCRGTSRTGLRHAGPLDRPFAAGAWLGDDRLFTPLSHEPRYDYPLIVWLPDSRPAAGAGSGFDLS
ncbi:MAG: hypothetical protein ACKOTB_00640, partial [Planctomycetia bacterium]